MKIIPNIWNIKKKIVKEKNPIDNTSNNRDNNSNEG